MKSISLEFSKNRSHVTIYNEISDLLIFPIQNYYFDPNDKVSYQ